MRGIMWPPELDGGEPVLLSSKAVTRMVELVRQACESGAFDGNKFPNVDKLLLKNLADWLEAGCPVMTLRTALRRHRERRKPADSMADSPEKRAIMKHPLPDRNGHAEDCPSGDCVYYAAAGEAAECTCGRDDLDECECCHVRDEHESGGPCQARGAFTQHCSCPGFELQR